jgi:hypothetical protein
LTQPGCIISMFYLVDRRPALRSRGPVSLHGFRERSAKPFDGT